MSRSKAAKVLVDKVAEFAGHKPIPDFIVRFILEEAAMVRVGMKPMPGADEFHVPYIRPSRAS